MASTNQTTNYGLPIYNTGDRASWTDTNAGFSAIDTAVKKAVDDSTDAIDGLATVSQTANTALGTATSAAADASTALTGLDTKQDKTDNNLDTTAKTIVGAINEVANDVAGKQNSTDNSLDTTSKTIVGAINEVNELATAPVIFRTLTEDNLEITAGTALTASKATEVVSGYTAKGIVAVTLSTARATISEFSITSGGNASVTLRNTANETINVVASVVVMYVKA